MNRANADRDAVPSVDLATATVSVTSSSSGKTGRAACCTRMDWPHQCHRPGAGQSRALAIGVERILTPSVEQIEGKLMSRRRKPVWRKIWLCQIVVGLVVALLACTDFKKDFLCRPNGICVNASDGGHGIGP